jgi:PilZ domain
MMPSPGEAVQFSFRLPVSHRDIIAAGTVVWANDTRQGIRFMKVSEQNQQTIRGFISEVEE